MSLLGSIKHSVGKTEGTGKLFKDSDGPFEEIHKILAYIETLFFASSKHHNEQSETRLSVSPAWKDK